jgi:hypothetical protein
LQSRKKAVTGKVQKTKGKRCWILCWLKNLICLCSCVVKYYRFLKYFY